MSENILKGKTALFKILLVVICTELVLIFYLGQQAYWEMWGVAEKTYFGDLRVYSSAVESMNLGFDPLYYNPADPNQTRLNQTRLVQVIFKIFNLTSEKATALGMTLVTLFYLSVFIFCKPFDKKTGIILSIAIFSPSVMLAVERGNTDLFAFFLVGLALFFQSRVVSFSLLTFSAFFKLFPIFSIAYFLKFSKKAFWGLSLLFLLCFLFYLFLNRSDLAAIFSGTPKDIGLYSYGAGTFNRHLTAPSFWIPPLAIILFISLISFDRYRKAGHLDLDKRFIDSFRVGAGIYCGTFLLGNNFDYRQIFLIFIIPQLVAWLKNSSAKVVVAFTLVAIVLICWMNITVHAFSIIRTLTTGLEGILEWSLFATLFYLLLLSLPSWLEKDFFRFLKDFYHSLKGYPSLSFLLNYILWSFPETSLALFSRLKQTNYGKKRITFKYHKKVTLLIRGSIVVLDDNITNPDYVIEGKDIPFNRLIKRVIQCILVNPDKRYKLNYDRFTIVPHSFNDKEGGVIDMVNKKIVHPCQYHSKIVSFSLYNNKKLYLEGALMNLKQYTKQYPDIKCYFYVREDVPEPYVNKLISNGAVVIRCIFVIDSYMMATRFFAVENKHNELYLSRDVDSRLTDREVKAIEQWNLSGKKFHIIRDHPFHGVLMLGGMWGVQNSDIDNIRFLMMDWFEAYLSLKYTPFNKCGYDQDFLADQIYELTKNNSYVNDEFFDYGEEVHAIDAPKKEGEHIGQVIHVE